MANFYETVLTVLKADDRFVSEDGTFLRNAVYEAAMKMDAGLIRLLLANKETRSRFFVEVDGVKVFDKIGFAWVINNRQFLPDSYTRFKNKIGLADENGDLISTSGKVELVFPYKDCVLEGGQTKDDQKRQEIFYNETLAPDEVDRLLYPKVFSGAKRYTKDGFEDITQFSESDNLIVKGNNLLVISSLLKRYEGKVKCVYIDPPYNPTSNANTFAYNNSFNRSTWLTFMKTRLQMAKRFLTAKGVLIVAIDKNEQPRLQILIEEIFPEYEVDCITVIHNPRGTIGNNFSYTHEYAIFVTPKGKKVICSRKLSESEIEWSPLRNWGGESLRTDAKNCFYPVIVKDEKIIEFGDVSDDSFHPISQTEQRGDEYYVYPIDTKGVERKWRYARQTVESIFDMLRVKKTKIGYDIELGKNFGTYKTVWIDSKFDASVNGTQLLKNLIPNTVFSYPKSLYTVVECVGSVVKEDKDALILDFFGGSGTTGHAVMEINKQDGGHRRFILVEQMDYVESDTLVRNLKVLNEIAPESTITFFQLAKLNQKFVEEIEAATDDDTLSDIYGRMLKSGFISCKVDPAKIDEAADDYAALSLTDKKRFLMEILDKNLLYVNYCDIDDEEFGVSDSDKAFTRSFYRER
ncbi:MAG: site-specific DNA-methyltransferase [Phascolarctobacterium sp.]|uniref:site-specific DNA-methyltransferase n=1 Tax=Phascolarctobacterium sp. TaxID=2049039 RepID=UPI0026DB0DA1|nr:site-specific DNA-methyltransferase [Phascolarctobacterium sp.]MDO4921200.1 site-specific DNA-methyltransferase [Phascolarctobacterium sp.]